MSSQMFEENMPLCGFNQVLEGIIMNYSFLGKENWRENKVLMCAWLNWT